MSICVDMNECNKKKKCLFGPNEGKAYNPSDPCCGAGVFDNASCDCVPETAWRDFRGRWSILTTGAGIYAGRESYSTPGWYNGYQRWSTPEAYYQFVYIHSAYFSSSRAYISCEPTDRNGVLQIDYTISDSGAGLIGLEDDVRRNICVWPESCKVLSYSCASYNRGNRGSNTYTVTGYMTARRIELDPETGEEVLVRYKLYDDMDLNDPNTTPEYIQEGIADIPMFGGENVGSFFSNDCECLGYDDPANQ